MLSHKRKIRVSRGMRTLMKEVVFRGRKRGVDLEKRTWTQRTDGAAGDGTKRP